jgi:hypothetical protein
MVCGAAAAWYLVVPGPAGGGAAGRVVAVNGGPSLVSGCCGSPWAADRPTSGRFPALAGVSGPGGCLWGTALRLTVRLLGVGGVLVEDDFLHGAGGVAPGGELVQLVEVPLLCGPP